MIYVFSLQTHRGYSLSRMISVTELGHLGSHKTYLQLALSLYSMYISVRLFMFLEFILDWAAPLVLFLMKWFCDWEITKTVNNDSSNYNPYILLTVCQILLGIYSLTGYQNNPMGNIILTLRQRCEAEWDEMMCPKSYSYRMTNGNFPLLLD